MKRKILAAFLTAVISLSPITVFAENTETYTDFSPFLSSIGIELPANEVDLEDNQRAITKAEFVYLVISAMGQNAHMDNKYLTFPDVKLDSWYHDKLIIAASKEIIYGHENGYFGVNDEVKEDVGALIIMRALGFGMLPAESANKSNLIAAHSSIYTKLLKGVNRDGVVSVSDAYSMIYNMLCSGYVVKDFAMEDSYHVETGEMYMQSSLGLKMLSGRITGNAYTALGIGRQGLGKRYAEFDGVKYKTLTEDAIKYLGYSVDFCFDEKNETVLYIIPKEGNKVTRILSTDLTSCQISGGNIVFSYEDDNGALKRFSVTTGCDFVYNGETEGFTKGRIDDLKDNKVGEIEIVESNNNVLVNVTAYDTMIVDTVSSYDKVIYGKYGAGKVSVDEEIGGYLIVEKDGEKYSPYEIKKDDVIQYAISGSNNNRKIIVCDFNLTGAVTSSIHDNKIEIDNVTYPVSAYFRLNRLPSIDINLGMKQKFLFNANGELVDIVENSVEYDGEYVFITEAKMIKKQDVVRIKYVTMDASFVTGYLAEKVKYNGTKSLAEDVLALGLLSGGTIKRQLIYIKKNADGDISSINTADQRDIMGTFNSNNILVLEASERERKCKQQTAWLEDVNDEHFPEFYTDSETKMLMVPASGSDDATFTDESSYEVKSISYFRDAEDYIVEAYNYNDFNVAGIMLLRQNQEFDSVHSNNNIVLVTSVGEKLDEDDEIIPYVKGYQNGELVEINLLDADVLRYGKKGQRTDSKKIKKYDVARFNLDNNGYAIEAEYIKNVESDCEITNEPEGQNNGNAIIVGKVVAHKDNYLKLKFTPSASTIERVFRGSLSNITIYDNGICGSGTVSDLTPGSKVLIRVYYTTLRDAIVIK